MGFQITLFRRPALACLALACAPLGFANHTSAEAGTLSVSCSGTSYKADGPFPTPETYSLVITDGAKSVSIGGPGFEPPVKAPIVSNNSIQLKFTAGKLTGEYFHFTGDLFLIQGDGRLTRLVCQPS